MNLRLHGDTLAPPGALDFATCLWPEPLPDSVQTALEQGLAARDRYPDERPAREAIAARHGRAPEQVLLLNGACEAFWLLAHALWPRRAACVHPGFTEPEAALRAVGTDVVRVPLHPDDWSLDPASLPDGAEMIVLGNPSNPTGTLTAPETLVALARESRWLVLDESFIDFVVDREVSLADRADIPGLVVVRSLTKLYALAGIRAGYLLAEPQLVERLGGHRQPWNVNALACHALAACAEDLETASRVAREVARARAELVAALASLPGVSVWPSAANFLLLRVPDGPAIGHALRARGIAVRPAASFPGLDENHIRIAIRPQVDNAQLLAALSEVLA